GGSVAGAGARQYPARRVAAESGEEAARPRGRSPGGEAGAAGQRSVVPREDDDLAWARAAGPAPARSDRGVGGRRGGASGDWEVARRDGGHRPLASVHGAARTG